MPLRIDAAAVRRRDPARAVLAVDGVALGTTWRVRYVERSATRPGDLEDEISRLLARITAEMSQWEPESVLSAFNHAPAGAWVRLPPDFATVVATALDIAEQSDGAFDPTHGRAAALLGYGALETAGPPSQAQLDDALASAGWRRLEFDPGGRRLRQPGGLWLDLSGIAKGFAVDAVADLLRSHGVEDALVEIGGELVGRGLKPDGSPWWVDLEGPRAAPSAPPPLRVGLHENAVATSGDAVRGAHTLNPGTGRPLGPHVASVSVIHDRAMWADAWATALTVLGPIPGSTLAARRGLAAVILERSDTGLTEHTSPALREMLEA